MIAIDYTAAYEQGAGIGRLVRQLVNALLQQENDTQYKLWVSGFKPVKPLPPLKNAQWYTTRLEPVTLARIWHRLHVPLPIETWLGNISLYHATDFVLPPTLPKTKTVLTVHDLSFVRVPEAASPDLKRYLDRVVPHSIQKATHIIADSEATKQDICEVYSTPPHKITVLLSGIEERFFEKSTSPHPLTALGLSNVPYFLCIGTVQPRKNYSRVIRALAMIHKEGFDAHVIIVGGKGWLEDEMYTTLDETKMRPYVHLVGFIEDEKIPSFYQHATGVVFPSLYEGFGFPILEGMASGVPVITANVSSMPEVAGDATLLVDPYLVDEIAYSMQRLLTETELRQTLIEKGLERSKLFSWDTAAKKLKNIYDTLL